MFHQKNKVEPLTLSGKPKSLGSNQELNDDNYKSFRDVNDISSTSTFNLDESSYLKLKPFSKLDPTLKRLITFLKCFGITANHDSLAFKPDSMKERNGNRSYSNYLWISATLFIIVITGEVVYDVNLRQSKLLAEQKRSTPLLTSVIVAYSWLTLVIPIICDFNLMLIGSHLFCFYSRTTATICNGKYQTYDSDRSRRTDIETNW